MSPRRCMLSIPATPFASRAPKSRHGLELPSKHSPDGRPYRRAVLPMAEAPAGPGEEEGAVAGAIPPNQAFLLCANCQRRVFMVDANSGPVDLCSDCRRQGSPMM